jgi:hypothetical protein
LAYLFASKISTPEMSFSNCFDLAKELLTENPAVIEIIIQDLNTIV